jgi:thymidylate synthase
VNLLRQDPDSRRAVVPIYARRDVGLDSRDIPCTTTLQFLLRGGKLTMITTMRSNDAILGMPYDVFNFAMIHEWMACRLGVELGDYIHFAGSLHYYGSDEAKLREIVAEPAASEFEMPAMNPETIAQELSVFQNYEEDMRLRKHSDIEINGFFQPFAKVLKDYAEK